MGNSRSKEASDEDQAGGPSISSAPSTPGESSNSPGLPSSPEPVGPSIPASPVLSDLDVSSSSSAASPVRRSLCESLDAAAVSQQSSAVAPATVNPGDDIIRGLILLPETQEMLILLNQAEKYFNKYPLIGQGLTCLSSIQLNQVILIVQASAEWPGKEKLIENLIKIEKCQPLFFPLLHEKLISFFKYTKSLPAGDEKNRAYSLITRKFEREVDLIDKCNLRGKDNLMDRLEPYIKTLNTSCEPVFGRFVERIIHFRNFKEMKLPSRTMFSFISDKQNRESFLLASSRCIRRFYQLGLDRPIADFQDDDIAMAFYREFNEKLSDSERNLIDLDKIPISILAEFVLTFSIRKEEKELQTFLQKMFFEKRENRLNYIQGIQGIQAAINKLATKDIEQEGITSETKNQAIALIKNALWHLSIATKNEDMCYSLLADPDMRIWLREFHQPDEIKNLLTVLLSVDMERLTKMFANWHPGELNLFIEKLKASGDDENKTKVISWLMAWKAKSIKSEDLSLDDISLVVASQLSPDCIAFFSKQNRKELLKNFGSWATVRARSGADIATTAEALLNGFDKNDSRDFLVEDAFLQLEASMMFLFMQYPDEVTEKLKQKGKLSKVEVQKIAWHLVEMLQNESLFGSELARSMPSRIPMQSAVAQKIGESIQDTSVLGELIKLAIYDHEDSAGYEIEKLLPIIKKAFLHCPNELYYCNNPQAFKLFLSDPTLVLRLGETALGDQPVEAGIERRFLTDYVKKVALLESKTPFSIGDFNAAFIKLTPKPQEAEVKGEMLSERPVASVVSAPLFVEEAAIFAKLSAKNPNGEVRANVTLLKTLPTLLQYMQVLSEEDKVALNQLKEAYCNLPNLKPPFNKEPFKRLKRLKRLSHALRANTHPTVEAEACKIVGQWMAADKALLYDFLNEANDFTLEEPWIGGKIKSFWKWFVLGSIIERFFGIFGGLRSSIAGLFQSSPWSRSDLLPSPVVPGMSDDKKRYQILCVAYLADPSEVKRLLKPFEPSKPLVAPYKQEYAAYVAARAALGKTVCYLRDQGKEYDITADKRVFHRADLHSLAEAARALKHPIAALISDAVVCIALFPLYLLTFGLVRSFYPYAIHKWHSDPSAFCEAIPLSTDLSLLQQGIHNANGGGVSVVAQGSSLVLSSDPQDSLLVPVPSSGGQSVEAASAAVVRVGGPGSNS